MPAALKPRPKYLNLTRIKQPISALLSILHRASGAVLFLCIPLALAALQASLGSADGFARLAQVAAHPLAKLMLLGIAWAYLHHFCAGIRYLLLDVHKGIDLKSARASSYAVFGVSLSLTLLTAVCLW